LEFANSCIPHGFGIIDRASVQLVRRSIERKNMKRDNTEKTRLKERKAKEKFRAGEMASTFIQ
jgi:hypothetical protein